MKTPPQIAIMADYGDAYAWNDGASTGLAYLFPGNETVKAIDHELLLWSGWFWKSLDNRETFPWAEFHAHGLTLATRLHDALPMDLDIEISYGRPTEDPQYQRGEKIIIRPCRQQPPAMPPYYHTPRTRSLHPKILPIRQMWVAPQMSVALPPSGPGSW